MLRFIKSGRRGVLTPKHSEILWMEMRNYSAYENAIFQVWMLCFKAHRILMDPFLGMPYVISFTSQSLFHNLFKLSELPV